MENEANEGRSPQLQSPNGIRNGGLTTFPQLRWRRWWANNERHFRMTMNERWNRTNGTNGDGMVSHHNTIFSSSSPCHYRRVQRSHSQDYSTLQTIMQRPHPSSHTPQGIFDMAATKTSPSSIYKCIIIIIINNRGVHCTREAYRSWRRWRGGGGSGGVQCTWSWRGTLIAHHASSSMNDLLGPRAS